MGRVGLVGGFGGFGVEADNDGGGEVLGAGCCVGSSHGDGDDAGDCGEGSFNLSLFVRVVSMSFVSCVDEMDCSVCCNRFYFARVVCAACVVVRHVQLRLVINGCVQPGRWNLCKYCGTYPRVVFNSTMCSTSIVA